MLGITISCRWLTLESRGSNFGKGLSAVALWKQVCLDCLDTNGYHCLDTNGYHLQNDEVKYIIYILKNKTDQKVQKWGSWPQHINIKSFSHLCKSEIMGSVGCQVIWLCRAINLFVTITIFAYYTVIMIHSLLYRNIWGAIYFLWINTMPNYFYSQSECLLHVTYIHLRHICLQK